MPGYEDPNILNLKSDLVGKTIGDYYHIDKIIFNMFSQKYRPHTSSIDRHSTKTQTLDFIDQIFLGY